MTILRSKAFWTITGTAATVAGASLYDKIECKRIRENFIAEAKVYGDQPFREGDHERKITVVQFSTDSEEAEAQRAIFKQYSADILTKAGVDYQCLEFVGSKLDKRYYELKDEKEIKEVADGQVPKESDENIKKPSIFSEFNFIKPMAQYWFVLQEAVPSGQDELQSQIYQEQFVKPLTTDFFTNGIVGLNCGSFRAILWGFHDAHKETPKIHVEPRMGMVNCEFPTSFFKRTYMVLP